MPLLSTCNFVKYTWFWNNFSRHAKIQKNPVPALISNPVPIPNSASISTLTPETPRVWKLKWEKTLPKKLTIEATEGISTLLKLKVEIKTTDTAEKKSVTALLDSSRTGECIDRNYAKCQQFYLIKLTQPIPVYNIDGSPNESGSITEVVSLILHYKNHSEWTSFCVTGLSKQKLILGHSQLHKHNLKINWGTGEFKMSRCPPHCCSRCRKKLHQERIAQKTETRRIDICSIGPIPIDHNSDSDCKLDCQRP